MAKLSGRRISTACQEQIATTESELTVRAPKKAGDSLWAPHFSGNPTDRLPGAQALGEDGPAVDKRVSAQALAMRMGATIYDLEAAELGYAPQFGSAKDPIRL
jgi:hypothetical protein